MTQSGETRDGSTARRVRLPGFVPDEPLGLGDAVKRVTSSLGIRPCAPCQRRAERLNSWMILTGRER
jgi:hypothetical protein